MKRVVRKAENNFATSAKVDDFFVCNSYMVYNIINLKKITLEADIGRNGELRLLIPKGVFMYEEVVNFIRKKQFSPTILYNILESEYMIDYFALQKTEKVIKKQNVHSIFEINYSVLNLSDTIAVLNAIYLQESNMACPSKMFNDGKLSLIANRLEQLDVPPAKGCLTIEYIIELETFCLWR